MAERRSALAYLPLAASAEARVSLSESRPASLLQVAAWPDTLATVEAVVGELLGLGVPPLGTAVADPNLTIAAIAPGRFLIAGIAPDLAPRLEAALPSEDAAVTDLSHGRVILRLQGDAAAELLAKGVALDLHPAAFPPGRVAQTAIHHIDVLLHRRAADSFDLWALRGFAEALAEWLVDAGLEFAIAVER
jgi:methylglutamate dehydrogenase subunit D